MKKRLFALLLCSIMVFSFTACGKEEKKGKDNESNTNISLFFEPYKGVWTNAAAGDLDEELIIKGINNDDGSIIFDYEIYRTTSFNNVKATVSSNVGTFKITNEIDWTIEGTMTFENNTITLSITKSSSENIIPRTIVFDTKTNKSQIQNKEY